MMCKFILSQSAMMLLYRDNKYKYIGSILEADICITLNCFYNQPFIDLTQTL